MESKPATFFKNNDGYGVAFERILHHPVEKVWDAITRPEELKYWFTDIVYEPVPGAAMTIRFRDKDQTASYGEIVVVDPPHRFVWTWEGELAEWELFAIDTHTTRLVFRYSKMAGEYTVNAAAGFHSLLDLLRERLDGSNEQYPFGADQNDPAAFPYRVWSAVQAFTQCPECVQHPPVIVEKWVRAPLQKVWDAITSREQMAQWYFTLDDFRAEPGFRFSFRGQGKKGQEFVHVCVVTEVVPFRKLQYSWQYEGYPGYSVVTFELSETDQGTLVRLSHFGLETFPQETDDFARANFEAGWNGLIGKQLPAFVEG